jgi:hypothetical protein
MAACWRSQLLRAGLQPASWRLVAGAVVVGGSVQIIVGCSTVDAEDGPALKAVMRCGLIIVVILPLATGVAAYLYGLAL